VQTEKTLNEAIGTGEILSIIYHGGSQPGTTRKILPLKITGNKVRARCYTSNAVKTFVIEKIELCPDQVSSPAPWNPSAKNLQKYKNLSDVYVQLKDELTSYGWHVEFAESDNVDSASLSLHTYFKNGKLRKTPVVSLVYDKYTVESMFNIETGEFTDSKKESTRPYCTQSRAFGKIDRAVDLFKKKAKESAPKQER